MQCEYCDSVLTAIPADRTCPHCGGKLSVQTPAQSAGRNFCPKCGARTQEAFCPSCGHDQRASLTSARQSVSIHVGGGNSLRCPYCFSTGVATQKRGFSLPLGIAGFFLIPVFGLFLGFIGSDKTVCTCPNCRHHWKI